MKFLDDKLNNWLLIYKNMFIFEALFYILPTYIANSSATLTLSIPKLKDWRTPIDFGYSIGGKRILGDGKSFQGLVFGAFWALITGLTQYFLAQKITFTYLTRFNQYSLKEFLLFASVLGLGAMMGDIIKSFFKRRFGIKRGRPWPPFDQLDFLIGGLIFGAILYFPGWKTILILIIITPIGHLLSNITAYLLKLKHVWW